MRRAGNTGGIILDHGNDTVVRLKRRTYSPVPGQAGLPKTITVPWWRGRTLRYEYARPDWRTDLLSEDRR